METYWGIDLGGTKIEGVILCSLESPEHLCRIRIDTESDKGYEHILSRICHLIEQMSTKTKQAPSCIGLGHPGAIDPESGILKNSNTTCLNGQLLRKDLSKLLDCEIISANDANCFALAEARFGAAKNANVVFGVILGTGVGGGIVVNNRVIDGCQGIAGEWGHNVLIDGGPECYCGKQGCVETIISGPGLERYYALKSGSGLSLREIASRAQDKSETFAVDCLNRLTEHFGRALAVVINILDPDVIVLGGGVSNISILYSEGVKETSKHVFNKVFRTKIVKNKLGDSAGVFGAAMLTAI